VLFSAVTDVSGVTHPRVFWALEVDLAVRDSDAFLYRVGFHLTLLGSIIAVPPPSPVK
jgi:hypothetical protein